MTPSKSIPLESNNDVKEKDSYVRVGTLISMHITDILSKTVFFLKEKTHNNIKIKNSIEVKLITVVDTWIHSLR